MKCRLQDVWRSEEGHRFHLQNLFAGGDCACQDFSSVLVINYAQKVAAHSSVSLGNLLFPHDCLHFPLPFDLLGLWPTRIMACDFETQAVLDYLYQFVLMFGVTMFFVLVSGSLMLWRENGQVITTETKIITFIE